MLHGAAQTRAGIAYGAIVFLLGFLLGAIRVLVVAPRIGAVGAVLLETPIILITSWRVSHFCIARFGVSATAAAGVVMGLFAFATLMCGEIGLSLLVFRQSLSAFVQGYQSLAGAIGLAAQIVFAFIPLIQIMRTPP